MPIRTPIVTFSSLADATGQTIPDGVVWRILDSSGVLISAGLGDGSAIYPARYGNTYDGAELSNDATGGYQTISGGISAVSTP